VFDEMPARDDSLNLSETFLWSDEDEWASLISFRVPQIELLMSHDKTKTLELGVQDGEENNRMGFI
jgi:hypothetical protein